MSSSRTAIDHKTQKRTFDGSLKAAPGTKLTAGSIDPQHTSRHPVPSVDKRKERETLPSPSTARLPIVGRRKMQGKALKTGVLKRSKTEEGDAKGDAKASSASKESSSNAYLEEMKKYSDQLCAEERHARPLVK